MRRTVELSKKQYDEHWGDLSLNEETPWRKQVKDVLAAELQKVHFDSILEVGCGYGQNLRNILDYCGDALVYGLDVSDVGIQRAKNYHDYIQYFCGSAEKIPLKNVDVVFSVHALEQMKSCLGTVISELYRVTGDTLILIEPFYEHQNILGWVHNLYHDYARHLPAMVTAAGFTIMKFERLPYSVNPFNRSSLMVCKKYYEIDDRV
jgi:ubiquinone/menaquinone biosynthesis C-methylase UbiE